MSVGGEKVEVLITGLDVSISNPSNFVLILEEQTSKQKIPLLIGSPEANAIAIHLEKMKIPRPLTHDLFYNYLQLTKTRINSVLISKNADGFFNAEIDLTSSDNIQMKLDSRASDAIVLALKFECPIFMAQQNVDEAEFSEQGENKSFLKGSWKDFSMEELQALLEKLLAKEDYESAGRIRDFITKRKENTSDQ